MTAVTGGETTDAELVGLAKAGDREAFRVLFERHSPRVAAACRSKLRSQPDVDDAVQEAFFRALANLDQLRDPDSFGAWVRSIAVRACVDHHRVAHRVIVLDPVVDSDHADHSPLPDELVVSNERDAAIRRLLVQLGERDRQALYMRHINEAGVPEIASSLGLTEGSTRVMLTRARERFRVVAASLGSFVPWSWRRWIREHVATVTPTLEVLVVAVAVGLAGGFSAPSAVAEGPSAEISSQDVGAPKRARPKPRVAEHGRPPRTVGSPARAAAPQQAPTAMVPAISTAPDAEDRRMIHVVTDSVDVDREYPDEDESQEVLDVTIFSADDEHTLRVYGNQVTKRAEDATAGAEDLVGEGSEE